jgi:NAD(P)-dependent dehydrogenase (short-subunit alcohol dehydrogenase family)
MAVIKFWVSLVVFYLLWQLSDYITPLFSWASNLFMLAFIAWTAGKYLAKHLVLPNLPQVSPKGKGVLVTGCDSGFGHTTALLLKKEGFHVFACCLNPEGEGAKTLISRSQGRRLTVVPLDVTNDDSVKECFKAVNDIMNDPANGVKELFAIVNNAGVMEIKAVEMTTAPHVNDFKKHLEVNFLGLVRVTRMFLPLIRKSKGRVVNMSSISARLGVRNFSAYSCSKAAVSKFSECLQMELSCHGVKVVTLEPWIARTPMLTSNGGGKDCFIRAWNEETSEEVKHSYGQAYMDKFLSNIKILQAMAMDPEKVTDTLMQAVTSHEPDAFYRIAPVTSDWIFWIVNEFIPQDLRCCAKNLMEAVREQIKGQ